MTCAACPITVKKALSRVAGVTEVSVSNEKKQATVVFDDTQTTVAALTRATTDAGYPSTPVKAQRNERDHAGRHWHDLHGLRPSRRTGAQKVSGVRKVRVEYPKCVARIEKRIFRLR